MAAEEDEKKSQRQKKSSKKTKRPATGGANQSRVGKKYKKRKTATSAGEEATAKEGEKEGDGGDGEGGGVGGGNTSVTAGSEEAIENGHEFGNEDEDEEVEKIQLKPLVDQEMKKGIGFEKKTFERKTTKKRHSVNSIPG